MMQNTLPLTTRNHNHSTTSKQRIPHRSNAIAPPSSQDSRTTLTSGIPSNLFLIELCILVQFQYLIKGVLSTPLQSLCGCCGEVKGVTQEWPSPAIFSFHSQGQGEMRFLFHLIHTTKLDRQLGIQSRASQEEALMFLHHKIAQIGTEPP